jgi:hypothetical protein
MALGRGRPLKQTECLATESTGSTPSGRCRVLILVTRRYQGVALGHAARAEVQILLILRCIRYASGKRVTSLSIAKAGTSSEFPMSSRYA